MQDDQPPRSAGDDRRQQVQRPGFDAAGGAPKSNFDASAVVCRQTYGDQFFPRPFGQSAVVLRHRAPMPEPRAAGLTPRPYCAQRQARRRPRQISCQSRHRYTCGHGTARRRMVGGRTALCRGDAKTYSSYFHDLAWSWAATIRSQGQSRDHSHLGRGLFTWLACSAAHGDADVSSDRESLTLRP